MQQIHAFSGALKYEFRMQIRRRALWITFMIMGLFFTTFKVIWNRPLSVPAVDTTIYWLAGAHGLMTVAVGILLADRLPRDRRNKVSELLETLPGMLSARLLGKYLGSLLATIIPMCTIYAIGVGYILYRWHDIQVLPLALIAFLAIALPGLLFISAFSLACPALLWVPLYQFLFVGYWFWGNILSPESGIPTLSATLLTPIGGYMCTGFFNPAGREGVCSPGIQGATPLQGVESILLLLGTTGLVLFALWGYLKLLEKQA